MSKFLYFCTSDTTSHLVNLAQVIRIAWDDEVITFYFSNGAVQKLTWSHENVDSIDVMDDEYFQDLSNAIDKLLE